MGGIGGIGKSLGHAFSSATKAVTGAVERGVKNYTSKDFLTSPARWFAAGSTMGLSEFTNVGNWWSKQSYSRIVDTALAAAIAANAASTYFSSAGTAAGGASGGASGAGASGAGAGASATSVGAGAGTTGAAAGGGISSGTALAGGALALSAGSTIYQTQQAKQAAKQQAEAQARAEANAASAARESEIMRKQALLASQKSMAARRATAGAIANKLKNTTTSLGSDEEKLGD